VTIGTDEEDLTWCHDDEYAIFNILMHRVGF